jgi:hypothetical protein
VITSWSTSGVYSPIFETATDIVDLNAMRRVYPISGFNMLIAAYLESIKSVNPLPVKQFVDGYCKTNYGFNADQSARFWNALIKAPYEINQGKVAKAGLTADQLLDSAKSAAAVLNSLTPLNNKTEFEHYRLMAAIRVQYLSYSAIEIRAYAADVTDAEIKQLITKLRALQNDALDKKFIELNHDFLYPEELRQENELRGAKIKLLLARLSRTK